MNTTVNIDALPWSAIEMRDTEIPWDDLRRVANAAENSPEVRARLMQAMHTVLDQRKAGDTSCHANLADLAVLTIFALAAERMDDAGKAEVAAFLIEMLYLAGEDDDDFLLETLEATVGRFGAALIAPAERLLADHPTGLECDSFLWNLLTVARDADPVTKQRVIGHCVRAINNASDTDRYYSSADMPAMLLAELDPQRALPVVRALFENSGSPTMQNLVEQLEGSQPQIREDFWHPWTESVEDWLPRQFKWVKDWLAQVEEDDEPAQADPDDEYGTIGHLFNTPARDPGALLGDANPAYVVAPIRGTARSAGRNDPCPCGSGRKFKKCCGR